jgi:hypothetical protein
MNVTERSRVAVERARLAIESATTMPQLKAAMEYARLACRGRNDHCIMLGKLTNLWGDKVADIINTPEDAKKLKSWFRGHITLKELFAPDPLVEAKRSFDKDNRKIEAQQMELERQETFQAWISES